MQNKRKVTKKQKSLKRAFGSVAYNNYELRYIKDGELNTIFLERLEFELLVDNERGQKQLIKRKGGDQVEDLVVTFRNEDNTTVTINFNSKTVKVYNFKKRVASLEYLTQLDYKKVYAEFLKV